jgi:hypothetical protein
LPDGKWFLTEPVVPPFFVGGSKTLEANYRRHQGEYLLRREQGGKCQHCGTYLYHTLGMTPDKLAHYKQQQIGGGAFDCKGRVWNKKALTSLTYADLTDFTSIKKKLIWTLDHIEIGIEFDKFVIDREIANFNRKMLIEIGTIL